MPWAFDRYIDILDDVERGHTQSTITTYVDKSTCTSPAITSSSSSDEESSTSTSSTGIN